MPLHAASVLLVHGAGGFLGNVAMVSAAATIHYTGAHRSALNKHGLLGAVFRSRHTAGKGLTPPARAPLTASHQRVAPPLPARASPALAPQSSTSAAGRPPAPSASPQVRPLRTHVCTTGAAKASPPPLAAETPPPPAQPPAGSFQLAVVACSCALTVGMLPMLWLADARRNAVRPLAISLALAKVSRAARRAVSCCC